VRPTVAAFLLLLPGILAFPGAAAGAPPFSAALDREAAAPGEPFVYEVTLTLADDAFEAYRPPDFRGLTVLSRSDSPNRAMSVQMGGGQTRVENRLTWRYELALPAGATKPVTIGPAHVRAGGRELTSNSVPVRIGAGSAARAAPRPGGGLFPRGMFPGFADDVDEDPNALSSAPGVAFIRAVADKPRAFVGEQVTVTWYLYLTEPQNNFRPLTQPRTDGFWAEELPSTNPQGRLSFTERVEGGRRYQVAVLAGKALFPLAPGKLTVTPMEAEVSQVDFFGRPVRARRLKSDAVTVEALALPRDGQPAGFKSGNVGRYQVEAAVDRTAVAVGDAVTLTLTVTGTGNVRGVETPGLGPLPGWKAYEPKSDTTVEPGEVVTGKKTVEWLIRPERVERTVIPPFTIPTFDPTAKRYVELRTQPIEMIVSGEAVPGAPAAAGPAAPSGVENVLGGEIRPIRVRSRPGREAGVAFFRSSGFAATVAVPPVAFLAFVVGGRVRRRLAADEGRTRRRRMRSLADKRLRAARAHAEAGRGGAFHVEIDRVLRDLLSERLGTPVGGLPLAELRALLGARGMGEPEVARVVGALEAGDEARFAPGGGAAAPAALAAALAESEAVIQLIDKAPLAEAPRGSGAQA
jgi:hypothetical protein